MRGGRNSTAKCVLRNFQKVSKATEAFKDLKKNVQTEYMVDVNAVSPFKGGTNKAKANYLRNYEDSVKINRAGLFSDFSEKENLSKSNDMWERAAFSGIDMSPEQNPSRDYQWAETPDNRMVTKASMLPPQQRVSISP